MARVLRVLFWLFAGLYVIALLLFLIGTFGLFDRPKDPLSGIFLLPLGLPWNMLFDTLPDTVLPWLGALAPLFNLALLGLLSKLAGRR